MDCKVVGQGPRALRLLRNAAHYGASVLLCCTLLIVAPEPSSAQENGAKENEVSDVKTLNVEFKHDGGQKSSIGEVVVEAQDGGMLFLASDGHLWMLQPDDIVSKTPVPGPMQPLSSEEIYAQFKLQVADGFKVHKTAHYVIIFNTSEVYAQWVGEMYEGLYRRFHNFWKSKKVELEEPRFPLVAVVFSKKEDYLVYAEREIGPAAAKYIGYYHPNTNRIISFDLTGVAGVAGNTRLTSTQLISQALAQPGAERTLATCVHEAVHQLAFNTGLQVRLSDSPRWFSEGLAMFFETPDTSNGRGGATVGKVNYHNLRLFANYLPKRPADSLTTLITDNTRMEREGSANDAYSESWALTYYLIKSKGKQYVAYLEELRQLEPLADVGPRDRVALFKKHFGDDLTALDKDFVAFMRRLR